MLTNRQKNILIFFISKALLFNSGYYLILSITNKDSWICTILGSVLGLLFCFILKKLIINNYINLNNIIIKLLLIIFSILIIKQTIFTIKDFINFSLLPNTPKFIIILPLILITIYISFKDYKLLSYLIECLFPICIFIILFSIISLIFNINCFNIKPILSHSNINILKSTFISFSLSTTPLILLLDIKCNNYNFYNSYIVSSIIITIIVILTTSILGPLTNIYKYPEYMILKDIKIFNFIENIENILSIPYIIDNIILLFTSAIFLKRMLYKKN